MIRVLLADDQALILESLEMMLNLKEDIRVVGAAHDGKEAIELAEQLHPDVILMDVRMPVLDGVASLERICARHPDIQVIVLTTFDDDEYVFKALRHGARGYLLKTIPVDELAKAIRTVHGGGALIHPGVAVKVFDHFKRGAAEAEARGAALPPAEIPGGLNRSDLRIVKLIAAGLSNREITSRLNLSEGTVRNYISNILLKLHLRDRTQIALWAVQNGLAQPGGEPQRDPP
jgi:DNA-binding NarL/FixJ family response regulator